MFRASRNRVDRALMGLPDAFVLPVLGDAVARHTDLRGTRREELVMIITNLTESLDRRVAAGNRLAIEGDPRIDPFDPLMVGVDGGVFQIGTEAHEVANIGRMWDHLDVNLEPIRKEVPRHDVVVLAFMIGRFPVTNFEYRTFLETTDDGVIPSSWTLGAYPWWSSNHPVHGVTIDIARRYAEWLSTVSGRRFRLPTETEWEVAALAGRDQDYPWGPHWVPGRANTVEWGPLTTTPVGAFLEGVAACGALDMVGNVEELVDSTYAPYPGGDFVGDGLYEVHGGVYPVTRGGSFSRFADLARCRRRHGPFPGGLDAVGFRLAEDP